MEKKVTLCSIRKIYQLINEFEVFFQKTHKLNVNEGMTLCVLREHALTSGELANELNLSHSNTSKILKSTNEKGLTKHVIGKEDKRKVYYTLTKKGKEKTRELLCKEEKVSPMLQTLIYCFENNE